MHIQIGTCVVSASVPPVANLVHKTIRHDVGIDCTCVVNSSSALRIMSLEMLELILGMDICIREPGTENLDVVGFVVCRRGVGQWFVVRFREAWWGSLW